jgi:hypothetical protein
MGGRKDESVMNADPRDNPESLNLREGRGKCQKIHRLYRFRR